MNRESDAPAVMPPGRLDNADLDTTGPQAYLMTSEGLASSICTETHAAELFTQANSGNVCWSPQLGWLIWDGARWRRDESGDVLRIASMGGQAFRDRAASFRDEKLASALFRFAKHCESERGVKAVLKLAENLCYVPVDAFDADPWLLTFRNGCVDLRDPFKLQPHDRSHLGTKLIDAEWRPGAPREHWDQFLADVLPDPDMRSYLQRAAGYSLSGSTREQCFNILWGSGANGKTTLIDVLVHCIGSDYAAQADSRSFIVARNDAIRSDLARLRGVRLVATTETSEGRQLDDALMKAITGGDALTVRHLYHSEFTYHPAFKLFLATNYCPSIRDTSFAMWRRIRLIPFTVQIPESRRDRDIKDKLLEEREGILWWMLEGAAAYHEMGLAEPPAVLAATQEYKVREDVVGRFLEECCEAAPGVAVTLKALYGAFTVDHDPRQYSQNYFGRRVTEKVNGGHLPLVEIVTITGVRCLKGLKLRGM